MLNHQQRERIKATVRTRCSGEFQSSTNDALTAVVAEIKAQHPRAFHTKTTVADRVFFHEPATRIPCASFYVAAPVRTPLSPSKD